jgi:hypothetical protein
MNIINNSIILFFASFSFILIGCADNKSAAQIEDLKKELAVLKSNSKTADDILILKNEIASLKEENEAAKKRQLADSKTLQLSQDKISELSQLSQVHDNGSRALSQRIDSLITVLPISELASWKSAGLIECRQLTIKEASSASVATLTPTNISLNKSTNSYVYVGAVGDFQGVIAKSESGYMAALSVSKNESELSTLSPDEAFTKIFSQQDKGGFKSAGKNDDQQSVGLFRLNENKQGFLYIKDPKNTLVAAASGLSISKGDQKIFEIASTKRGASMRFFDDIGDSAKIGLFLKDDNGEPVITVQGATKFDVLYPKIDRSK